MRGGAGTRAVLVGVAYGVIGVGVAALDDTYPRAWRLGAWVASGLLFIAHTGYELGVLHVPRTAALRAAGAAALGAFALALWANLHAVVAASGTTPRLLLAFVLFPVITGVPACAVAWVIAAVLRRLRR